MARSNETGLQTALRLMDRKIHGIEARSAGEEPLDDDVSTLVTLALAQAKVMSTRSDIMLRAVSAASTSRSLSATEIAGLLDSIERNGMSDVDAIRMLEASDEGR